MAQKKNVTDLMELRLQCVAQPDPMRDMLEWRCIQFSVWELKTDPEAKSARWQRN